MLNCIFLIRIYTIHILILSLAKEVFFEKIQNLLHTISMKILSLVGARPQFIKEALLNRYVQKIHAWEHILVHSGQHYDANISDIFFKELSIPHPKYHLGIGSGTHGVMTAAALTAVEHILCSERPDALLVYGDTNTTLAGSLAAAKLGIPIIHIEAGIRMLPKTMPEEINRVITDRLSSVLCCCSALGVENLALEGITSGVHITGDIQLDLFQQMKPYLFPEDICTQLGVIPEEFVVVTIHRDYNVDNPKVLMEILTGLSCFAQQTTLKVLFSLHPRTHNCIQKQNFQLLPDTIIWIPPQSYLEMMSLISAAKFVITDSGGLQKEAYYAGKRTVVVMPDSGWRELIDTGWNILTEPTSDTLVKKVFEVLSFCEYPQHIYGNGDATQRIVQHILNEFYV